MSGSTRTDSLWVPGPGDSIGDRYRLLSEIGRGGMAAVFLADYGASSAFQRLLAIKLMLPHLVHDPAIRDMFADEARISSLISHPNVVQVTDTGFEREVPFLAMEHLRGQTLSVWMRRARRLQLDVRGELLFALADAAEGLHAAHEAVEPDGEPAGVVHRDFNPRNVFITYEGQAKVMDFGIAAAKNRQSKTRTGEVKGTLSYMAPEQIRGGRDADRRIDVFSLGVVVWEALAAERLFRGAESAETMWNVVHRPAPALEDICDVSPELSDTIGRCLAKDPRDRPESARDVALVLRAAAESAGVMSSQAVGQCLSSTFKNERALEEIAIVESRTVSAPEPADARDDPKPARWRQGALVAALLAGVGGIVAAFVTQTPSVAEPDLVESSEAAASAAQTPVVAEDPAEPATAALPPDPSERAVDDDSRPSAIDSEAEDASSAEATSSPEIGDDAPTSPARPSMRRPRRRPSNSDDESTPTRRYITMAPY